MQILTRAAVICCALLLVSACGADDPPAPPHPSPAAPVPTEVAGDAPTTAEDASTSTAVAADRIPDGRYVRVTTTADTEAMGVDEEEAVRWLGTDGELPMALEFEGDRFLHYVTNDAGVEELGDLGTIEYEEGGTLVATSEGSGCPGCVGPPVRWSLDGDVLTMDAPADMPGAERLHIQGAWTREPPEQAGPTDDAAPATGAAGDRIPDGRYVRVATAADAEAMGIDDEVSVRWLGSDGEAHLALELEGDRFLEYGINEAGVEELIDRATIEYEEGGRLVVSGGGFGCPDCGGTLSWSLDGDILRLTGVADLDDAERFHMEGAWTREDG